MQVTGRVWRGSAFGGVKGRTELPGIVGGEHTTEARCNHRSFSTYCSNIIDYMNGKLWVDEFVTHHRDLKEINEGFDDMHVSPRRRAMFRGERRLGH